MTTATHPEFRDLTKANRARMAQARLKAGIRELDPLEARLRVATFLGNPRPPLDTIRLEKLLDSIPGIGRRRGVRQILERCRVGGERVCDLGPEARRRLANEVIRWGMPHKEPDVDVPDPDQAYDHEGRPE